MMSLRRPLTLPIILGIVMIVLTVTLTVGWTLLAVTGALSDPHRSPLYWTLLSVGITFLVLMLVGVVMYLTLSIKAVNLTRRQSNFIDSVTHELKSPIASLKLCLQTLSHKPVAPEEQASFLRYMMEDVERLDMLINHLLEAGRLERGEQVGEIEEVDLADLLTRCAATAALRYSAPADTVRLDLEPCRLRGRPVDVDLVFRNLLDNAVKYAGHEPRVDVSLRLEGGAAVVAIADNGRGIPPEHRRKIFGRFVRLGWELERQKTGTGLGLYIVRTVVRRMKGRVAVHGREPGPGTVFEVSLPGAWRAVDAPADTTSPASPVAQP